MDKIKVIKTEQDYQEALKLVEGLIILFSFYDFNFVHVF